MTDAEELAELKKQVSTLRHDIRGILSPAMLTADRLLSHADPSVKRAGEVIIRTVDRITARLLETKLGYEVPGEQALGQPAIGQPGLGQPGKDAAK